MVSLSCVVLLACLGLVNGILRVSNVTDCAQCGCLDLDPSSFERVSYVKGYNDTNVQTNATVFLITQNWYIAVHDITPNYDDLSVCFAVTYTYQGSYQPLVDGMWVCMDLDVPYYDVEHRTVIDPDQTTTNPDTGTIFVLYNPSREIPLVLGCTGCDMSDQDEYTCSGNGLSEETTASSVEDTTSNGEETESTGEETESTGEETESTGEEIESTGEESEEYDTSIATTVDSEGDYASETTTDSQGGVTGNSGNRKK